MTQQKTNPGSQTKNLIFDIGCNVGNDALFYAKLGYNVVAVDADPSVIETGKLNIKNPAIQFVNYAITNADDELIPLYVNDSHVFNSLIPALGGNANKLKEVVHVKSRTLKTLFQDYGVPHYCKIDVEGFDHIVVNSIGDSPERPLYISVEAECKPKEERFSEEGIFNTLDALRDAGYTKFKLVDQPTLAVLSFNDYYIARTRLYYKVIRKLQKIFKAYSKFYTNKQRLAKRYDFSFVMDSSGPFGEELDGNWVNYEKAKELYLYHRRAFFSKKVNREFSMWTDWHATY